MTRSVEWGATLRGVVTTDTDKVKFEQRPEESIPDGGKRKYNERGIFRVQGGEIVIFNSTVGLCCGWRR